MGRSSPGLYQSHDILAVKRWVKRPAPPQVALDRRRIGELSRDITDRPTCVRLVLALDGRALTIAELAELIPRASLAFRGLKSAKLVEVLDDICVELGRLGIIEARGINGHRIVRVNVVRRLRARPLLHVKRGPPTEPTLSGERC